MDQEADDKQGGQEATGEQGDAGGITKPSGATMDQGASSNPGGQEAKCDVSIALEFSGATTDQEANCEQGDVGAIIELSGAKIDEEARGVQGDPEANGDQGGQEASASLWSFAKDQSASQEAGVRGGLDQKTGEGRETGTRGGFAKRKSDG